MGMRPIEKWGGAFFLCWLPSPPPWVSVWSASILSPLKVRGGDPFGLLSPCQAKHLDSPSKGLEPCHHSPGALTP